MALELPPRFPSKRTDDRELDENNDEAEESDQRLLAGHQTVDPISVCWIWRPDYHWREIQTRPSKAQNILKA